MKTKSMTTAFLFVLSVVFWATTASATVIVDATKDNWMRVSVPGTNLGTSVVSLVTPPGTNTTHTLVGFDNLPVLTGAEVISATLRMERVLLQGMDVEVRALVLPASDDWTELGSSWNNYKAGTPWPGGGGGLADTSALLDTQPTPGGQQFDDWDVTSAVKDWLDGNTQNNGFLLNSISGGSGNDVRWASVQHATANPPQLIIEVIPEPSSLVVAGMGLVGFLLNVVRRRRR